MNTLQPTDPQVTIYRPAWRLLCNQWQPLLRLIAPYWLVMVAISWLSTAIGLKQSVFWMVEPLLLFAVAVYYTILVIKYLANLVDDEVNRPLQVHSVEWRQLYLLTLVVYLLSSAGLMLLILPGLYVMTRLALADFALVLQNYAIRDSLSTSWQQMQPWVWRMLPVSAVIIIISMLSLQLHLLLSQAGIPNWLLVPLFEAIGLTCNLLALVIFFRLYCLLSGLGMAPTLVKSEVNHD